MPKLKPPSNLDKFMQEARERFAYARDCDAEDRKAAQDDARFLKGGDEQWPPEALEFRRRADNPLPVVTWNVLPVYVASVVNDGRQSKPSIHAVAGDGGSKHTAEMLSDRIRQIEYESQADTVYDSASNQQVGTGRAWFRITTEYLPRSTRQVPRIKKIDDQFSVYDDPSAVEYDRSDAHWRFVVTKISKDEYKRRFGDRKDLRSISSNFFESGGNPATEWVGVGNKGEDVVLAEYWTREVVKTRKLYGLTDGAAVYEDELKGGEDFARDEEGELDVRDEDVYSVKQYLIDGVDILDSTEWLTEHIPIIPQWGQEIVENGQRFNVSLIRNAKPAQQNVNYYCSGIAQAIGSTNKALFFAPVGAFTNLDQQLQTIALGGTQVILYNTEANGKPLPPPTPALQEPPIQAMTLGLRQALDAIKSICGIFNPSLGAPSNETSGIAIESRKRESDNANYHFHGNAARSRNYAGRILLDLIIKLDARAKSVMARRVNGDTYTAKLGEPYKDPKTGETLVHDLAQGEYIPVITTGPAYTSARQAAYDADAQLIQARPELLNIIGDNFFRNSDAPGSEENAERMKRLIQHQTPWLIPEEGKENQQPLPPQVQQMMEQGKEQIMQLSQTVHSLQDKLDKQQIETESRERIAAMQEETKRMQIDATARLGEAKLGLDGAMFRLENTLRTIESHQDRMDRLFQEAQAAQAQQAPNAAPAPQQSQQQEAAPPAPESPQPTEEPAAPAAEGQKQ
jgi:Phage P22-like portal protein